MTSTNIKSSFFGSKQIAAAKKIIENIKETGNFRQAFTHTSYLNENSSENLKSYETMEFLGDSILNFYTTLFIYQSFSHYSEGQMSKLKQLIVQESTLAYLSKEIGLGEYLQLGSGERKNQGSNKNSILADVFESFVAALYLEKDQKTVWKFLNVTVFSWVKGKESSTWDYKSQLQEYCQAHKIKLYYFLRSEKRISNHQLFLVEAVLENNYSGKLYQVHKERLICREMGSGKNKKEAEQGAARRVIEKLGIKETNIKS